jgi:hypothetical protein
MSKQSCPRFSEYFGINKPQQELDFVDILPDTDLPLYIDPYAFKVGASETAAVCNNLVVDFFETLLDCIRSGRHQRGQALLNNLREPNETHLGVSETESQGRGVGREQAGALYDRLSNSKAVRSGMLRDLSDCELMIPQISQDKISDTTTYIVRGELATFTTVQCLKYSVPTRQVQRGVAWDDDNHEWVNGYSHLPIYKDEPLILVPKWMVRREIAVDHNEYYNDFVLNYLQQEHLNAGSGLVQTLKNGKRRVTKKSLREEHPKSKDWLREFSEQHPDVLKQYREYLNSKLSPINSGELEKLIRHVQQLHGGSPAIVLNFGEMTMGDKNTVRGNATGSVVGSGTINARNLTAYSESVNNSGLDPELIKVLIAAREAVETAGLSQTDAADVNDSLSRITAELQKDAKEPGLILRYFNRIKDVAAGVASVLSSAKTINDIIQFASNTPQV